MKKYLIMALFAIVALSANAQFYVGGSLELGTSTTKVGDADGVSTTIFGIAPEFGYNITDVFAIGTEASFGTSKTEDAKATNIWGIAPYVRANFADLGSHVKLFADVFFDYEWASKGDADWDGFEVGLRPGINVALNDHWGLIGKMTLFSYSKFEETKVTTFKFQPTSIKLGVVYNF